MLPPDLFVLGGFSFAVGLAYSGSYLAAGEVDACSYLCAGVNIHRCSAHCTGFKWISTKDAASSVLCRIWVGCLHMDP